MMESTPSASSSTTPPATAQTPLTPTAVHTSTHSLTHVAASIAPTNSITCPALGVKLTGDNFVVWKARLLPFLRANKLLPIVDGTLACPPPQLTQTIAGTATVVSNPAYDEWIIRDQIALGWILSTSADAIVGQLCNFTNSADAWKFLATSFAAHNHARATQLRMQLQTLRKGNQSVTEFLQQASMLVDQLASIGEVISSHEYQTHIFRGLGTEYQSLAVSISVQNQHQDMTREVLHGLLLSHEARLELMEPQVASPIAFNISAADSKLSNSQRQSNFNNFLKGMHGNSSISPIEISTPTAHLIPMAAGTSTPTTSDAKYATGLAIKQLFAESDSHFCSMPTNRQIPNLSYIWQKFHLHH